MEKQEIRALGLLRMIRGVTFVHKNSHPSQIWRSTWPKLNNLVICVRSISAPKYLYHFIRLVFILWISFSVNIAQRDFLGSITWWDTLKLIMNPDCLQLIVTFLFSIRLFSWWCLSLSLYLSHLIHFDILQIK